MIRHKGGDRGREATTVNNLDLLASSLGQPEEARSYYEQALAIFMEIGAVNAVRVVEGNLEALDHL